MAEFNIHRGGQAVSKEELQLIPIPPQTESYIPVSHFKLANTLTGIAQDILRDYVLVGENYAVARSGNQMFAVLKFNQGNGTNETALSIGFRNSYDKSMSLGWCVGATVFVCDNLAFQGDIVVMKKHTKNVFVDLENTAITTLYRSQNNYDKIIKDAEAFKRLPLTDGDAYRLLGLMYGLEILTPRQLPVVKEEWLRPRHEEFMPRTVWSFYNACTEAMKSTPPNSRIESHTRLHSMMLEVGEL